MFLGTAVFVIVAATAARIAQIFCARRDERRFPAPGRMLPVKGGQLHVQAMGSGEPVIILESGIAASSLNWSILQPSLAALTRACSYDRAGYGWSTGPDRSCSLQRMSENLHELMQQLSPGAPYVLVAHSFGGYIARAHAQRYGHELAGIVLLDPLTPEEWINPTPAQRWMLRRGIWFSNAGGVLAAFGVVRFCLWLLQRGNRQVPGRVLGAFGKKADETVRRIFNELLKLSPQTVDLIRARWSNSKFFWTMAAYIRGIPRCALEVLKYEFPREIPLTVISAPGQPPERLEEHRVLAARSRHGHHLVAGGSGHWVHLDEPDLIVQAVQDMLQSLKIQSAAKM